VPVAKPAAAKIVIIFKGCTWVRDASCAGPTLMFRDRPSPLVLFCNVIAPLANACFPHDRPYGSALLDGFGVEQPCMLPFGHSVAASGQPQKLVRVQNDCQPTR